MQPPRRLPAPNPDRAFPWIALLAATGASLSLAISRLAYELDPLAMGWLGSPLAAILCGLGGGLLGAGLAIRLRPDAGRAFALGLPPLISLIYVLSGSAANPLRGALLIGGGLLAAILAVLPARAQSRNGAWAMPALAGGMALIAYLLTLQPTPGRADSFEFQVVGPSLGIAHPSGYPLYTLLAWGFSKVPLMDSIAARINLSSALFAAGAVALFVLLLRGRLDVDERIAALAGLAFGLTPVFWSQAVMAEVYALHNLIALGLLYLAFGLFGKPDEPDQQTTERPASTHTQTLLALAALSGLGLAHHLTTVLFAPALICAVALAWPRIRWQGWLCAFALGAAGLLFYLYLPLRWPAVTGEPMPLSTLIEWMTGSRFSGALVWNAWRDDPARWGIVGRIVLEQVGWTGLLLAAGGLISMPWRKDGRAAPVLVLAGLAIGFYGLNYYIPDINVFLIPLSWLIGLLAAVGLDQLARGLGEVRPLAASVLKPLVVASLALVCASLATETGPAFDWQDEQALEAWGREALALPIVEGAAILADSEKIAPLEYLHRVEGLRPDLSMVVLGTEAEYYEQISGRLAAGQAVYLARYLPGLEGAYHLRSLGPLIEVGTEPLYEVTRLQGRESSWETGIRLMGYAGPESLVAGSSGGFSLYWQAPTARIEAAYQVRLRLVDAEGQVIQTERPAFPVDNRYPTAAWKPDEIIPDYHLLRFSAGLKPGSYRLEAAFAPPFSHDLLPLDDGEYWARVAEIEVLPAPTPPAQAGQRLALSWTGGALTGFDAPDGGLLGAPLELRAWFRLGEGLLYESYYPELGPVEFETVAGPTLYGETRGERLSWALAGADLRCGWGRPRTDRCLVGATAIEGETVLGALANFENRLLLLDAGYLEGDIAPGGEIELGLTWQAVRALDQDYTVFVQLIGPDGRPHGQVDSWPVQGTLPTSSFRPGQPVEDSYWVRLDVDAPLGPYQIFVGWYLLATNERLLLVDESGEAIGDHLVFEGLLLR